MGNVSKVLDVANITGMDPLSGDERVHSDPSAGVARNHAAKELPLEAVDLLRQIAAEQAKQTALLEAVVAALRPRA